MLPTLQRDGKKISEIMDVKCIFVLALKEGVIQVLLIVWLMCKQDDGWTFPKRGIITRNFECSLRCLCFFFKGEQYSNTVSCSYFEWNVQGKPHRVGKRKYGKSFKKREVIYWKMSRYKISFGSPMWLQNGKTVIKMWTLIKT